jgi:hypothetical protein
MSISSKLKQIVEMTPHEAAPFYRKVANLGWVFMAIMALVWFSVKSYGPDYIPLVEAAITNFLFLAVLVESRFWVERKLVNDFDKVYMNRRQRSVWPKD